MPTFVPCRFLHIVRLDSVEKVMDIPLPPPTTVQVLQQNRPEMRQGLHDKQALQQKWLKMRQDLHNRACTAAKMAQNASGPAQPSMRCIKIGPKCVHACITERALQQKWLKMRQELHVRACAAAKMAQEQIESNLVMTLNEKVRETCLKVLAKVEAERDQILQELEEREILVEPG